MAVPRLICFDKNEVELVHQQSLKSLNEIGVMVKSEPVLKMLAKAGASVDYRTGIAKLPEHLVMEAVRNAPKSYTLGGREPKHDKKVPVKDHPLLATTGLAVYTFDLETGAR